MNKKILLGSLFLATNLTFAQSLLNENFDSYTLGNVGTDLTAKNPGQGNWFITNQNEKTITASNFQFVAEAGKGNVYSLSSTSKVKAQAITAKDFIWANRTNGNDVLKIEYEFYTGTSTTFVSNHRFVVYSEDEQVLTAMDLNTQTRELRGLVMHPNQAGTANELKSYPLLPIPGGAIVPEKTWVKVTMYLDFVNEEIHYEIPSMDVQHPVYGVRYSKKAPKEVDMQAMSTVTTTSATTVKYDNINISAVDKVTLGVNDVVSTKFNVYPNPANDIITIANNESIGIEKVSIIDINGRVVKTQSFANESEIQVNISDLKAGVYIFNVSTKEGTATKKIIKK